MSEYLSEPLLERLNELLVRQLGLHFGPERAADLQRGIASAARECGCRDTAAFAAQLLAEPLSKRQIEVLAQHLTVGETYFFREPASFEVLQTEILPELIQTRRSGSRQLRIWSAGCCTGEEAYTLAIVVARLIPDWKDWQITILGTDVNPKFLEEAVAGVFNEWSFRDVPPGVKELYFRRPADRLYEIAPALRQLVTFSCLNLVADVYPSLLNNTNAMDLIVCRNVLMYFSPEQAARAVEQLERCLVDGGWLLASPTESSYFMRPLLAPVNFPGVTFYRKLRVPAELRPQAQPKRLRTHPPSPRKPAAGKPRGSSGDRVHARPPSGEGPA